MLYLVWCAHRPWTCRTADLEFTGPTETQRRQLPRSEVWRRYQRRHRTGVILGAALVEYSTIRARVRFTHLDAQKEVPPLHEMTCKVPSRLSNNLHGDVVPRHSGNLRPVIHILEWLAQSVEVSHTRIAIVLACTIIDSTEMQALKTNHVPGQIASSAVSGSSMSTCCGVSQLSRSCQCRQHRLHETLTVRSISQDLQ